MSGKILFFDIETSPNVVLSWAIGRKISLTHDNILKERQIICISYKWAHEKRVHTLDWGTKQCDKALLKKFVKVLAKADVAIGHNGDKYDVRFIAGRLLFHGLEPCSDLNTIDTLKYTRNAFYLNSNRLDYIGQFLNVGSKLETGGYSLWKQICVDKNAAALKKMKKYCEQDVLLLEKVYNKIKPYVKSKVHMGLLNGGTRDSCKACGSERKAKYGVVTTRSGRFQKYQCKDCGHVFRDTRQLKDT